MSSPVNINERDEMLAAEYAIGTLPHGERLAFEKRLESDPALQNRVRWWNESFIALGDEIEPVVPPNSVLKNVEKRLFASTTPKTSLWNSLGFWRGLSIASLAGLLVFGAVIANNDVSVSNPEQNLYMAQVDGDGSDVRLAALYDSSSKTLKLNRLAGKAPVNRDFELWVISGDNAPASLGVLPLDTSVEIAVPKALQAALSAGAILAISDEPSGGSPTGQPTGAVLATGVIVSI